MSALLVYGYLLNRKNAAPLEMGLVIAKLVVTMAGALVAICQQMGGTRAVVDSRWQAGALVCQESTTLPAAGLMRRVGMVPEEAQKLSPYTLSEETIELDREFP